jgi:hypothetical protein
VRHARLVGVDADDPQTGTLPATVER